MTQEKTSAQKIYLKDYTKPSFEVSHVQLDFNLNEDFCRVRAQSQITRTADGPLELDGVDLKLISLKIDGKELPSSEFQKLEEKIVIAKTPQKFTLEVETELQPQNNTSLEGLYKSNNIFCTQCEAQGFRTITYFLDRPDVMTTYDVTIEADKTKYPVLLSNGDRLKITDLGNGRHQAHWRDPHKKPCYLFALVAGDLGVIKDFFTTASGRKVNLEVYAAHGKQERCWHAMSSLKKSMKWDEEAFGREYDLNDYMIVAIDDFNAGAMENKGLNIFNSRLVLADKESATDDDFESIESVVAHEYFHNWTGNRVTLRDWFQLSLKEGLTVYRDQEFSADMMDRGVQRIVDVDRLRAGQFAEDAGPNAHPVRPESCMAVDNFFTMTIYEKGAELIRMMQNIVGRQGFRRGMDEYFKRHDGQAVTTEDFAAAISEPNNKDFTQFRRWYHQAGTPTVKVTEHYDSTKKQYTVTLEQSCRHFPQQATHEPFHIPLMMGLLNSRGQEMPLNCAKVTTNSDGKHLLELREAREEFIFTDVNEKPVLSILREFSAPVNLEFNAEDKDYYFLIAKDTDSFNRREAAQKMAMKQLSSLISQAKNDEPLHLDPALVAAYTAVLQDMQMDLAFKAKMLQLPTDAVLAQSESTLDAEAFLKARCFLRHRFASANQSAILEVYEKNHLRDDAKSRELKNTLLHYMTDLKDDGVYEIILSQYQHAKNMTDKMAALTLMCNSKNIHREKVVSDFYETWKNDSLVINKWFAAQASSQREDTLEVVKKLCEHRAFNITNPNNVYSLLRVFGNNLVRFHDPKTNAYEFYADKIIEIDAKNPQVAARLCAAFNFTQKLSPEMKNRALTQIKRILAVNTLSKNSRELLQTSL